MKRLRTQPRQVIPLPGRTKRRAPPQAPLRFTPYAWAKLLYLRDLGPTEIGGFGLTPSDQRLLVEDVQLVQQQCTGVTVEFDDQAIADFFDQQVDTGRQPAEFGRIWIHTHPGCSPFPSATDEATFARCFGRTDWAVMFILAASGHTYARLRLGHCPAGHLELPVQIDFSVPFPAAAPAVWDQEYAQSVEFAATMFATHVPAECPSLATIRSLSAPGWLDELPSIPPDERLLHEPQGWEAAHG
jgi:proteasome lid subunit RPN8/RPN11